MKWFLVIVVVLNVLVGLYGVLKQKPVADIGAQDINAAQLTILPAGWRPAFLLRRPWRCGSRRALPGTCIRKPMDCHLALPGGFSKHVSADAMDSSR